jgi:hypothetical protein
MHLPDARASTSVSRCSAARSTQLLIDDWDTGPLDAVLKEANPDPPSGDGRVTAGTFILT